MTLSDYRLQRCQWAPQRRAYQIPNFHLIFDTRIINLRLLFLRDITNKLFISLLEVKIFLQNIFTSIASNITKINFAIFIYTCFSYNSKCYCNHTKKASLFCIKTKPYIFITISYLITNKFRFLQTEKLYKHTCIIIFRYHFNQ